MSPSPRELLLTCYHAALTEVEGRALVARRLHAERFTRPVYLLAIGKAAESMARGALEALGGQIVAGADATSLSRVPRLGPIADAFVVTKRRSGLLPWPVHEGGHPIPNGRSLLAGQELAAFAGSIPMDSHVLVLLSGGASALVELLPKGVTLVDLQRVNEWLLGSGHDIADTNAVRRRLSLLKGGGLARMLSRREVTALAISDVPGDDVRWIGSGPLTPVGADEVLPMDLPEFVNDLLSRCPPAAGGNGAVPVEIIAGNRHALQAAARGAESRGVRAVIEQPLVCGDAADAGQHLARALLESPRGVIHVWGGETTLRLPPNPGRGGRAQHLALSAATMLRGHAGVYLLAAGTDGNDGPGEDAGALVDGDTVARGEMHAGPVTEALERADAGRFLEASGDLIQTGPTGTNVMDLILGWRT